MHSPNRYPKLDIRRHSLLHSPSLNEQSQDLFVDSPPTFPHVMSSEMRSHLGVPEVQHPGSRGHHQTSHGGGSSSHHHHHSQQPKLPFEIRQQKNVAEYPIRVTRQGSRIEYPFDVGRLSRQGSRVSASIRRNTGLSIDGQSLIDWPSLEGLNMLTCGFTVKHKFGID